MQLFVINIGNTNTQFSICNDGKIGKVESCPTRDLTPDILPHDIPVAIASVVPEKDSMFQGERFFILSPSCKTELDLSLVDKSTLGADRLANAIALMNFAKLPAICIDCGTAVTFESVDAENVFRGGAIMPGRMLLRKSLNDYTAKLPLAQNFKSKKPIALARNTLDAITAGCDIGILGAAQKIIKKMQIELGVEKCQVIATGGDADFFADNLLEISSGGKDFTLRGIVAAWKYAKAVEKSAVLEK